MFCERRGLTASKASFSRSSDDRSLAFQLAYLCLSYLIHVLIAVAAAQSHDNIMQKPRESNISPDGKGQQLPPLAPRDSPATSSRSRAVETNVGGRPPRLSHRSRAGCWTCRTRKVCIFKTTLPRPLLNDFQVKCDEKHPRCGVRYPMRKV